MIRMPGFGAEASISRSVRSYRGVSVFADPAGSPDNVVPQYGREDCVK